MTTSLGQVEILRTLVNKNFNIDVRINMALYTGINNGIYAVKLLVPDHIRVLNKGINGEGTMTPFGVESPILNYLILCSKKGNFKLQHRVKREDRIINYKDYRIEVL